MTENVILIVGAGVMGVSTAWAVRRRHPNHTIHLISPLKPSLQPASEDTGKIVRDAYNDTVYAGLAAEAMALWREEPLYRDFWHQTGWIVLHPSADEQSISGGPQLMSKERFLQRFPNTELGNIHSISEDPKTAWVDASRALEATIKLVSSPEVIIKNGETVKCAGVIHRHNKVVDLLWDGPICTGVVLDDRDVIKASSILLAMGHETPSFLRKCNLPCEDGERAGVSVLGIQLNDQQYAKYKDIPILVVPGIGEVLPPNSDKMMKVNNARSFRVPDLSLVETESPPTLESPYFKENWELLSWLLPDLKDAPVAFCRYCIDHITTTQDFNIYPVKERERIYVAFGGSFHGWKFLTNIGQLILQMMDGDESFHKDWKRWAGAGYGDVNHGLIHGEVVPKRTFPEE